MHCRCAFNSWSPALSHVTYHLRDWPSSSERQGLILLQHNQPLVSQNHEERTPKKSTHEMSLLCQPETPLLTSWGVSPKGPFFPSRPQLEVENFPLFFWKGQLKCYRNLTTPGAAAVKRQAQTLESTCWICEAIVRSPIFFLVQLQLIGALLLFPGPAGLPFPACWALRQVSFKGMNSNLINGKQFSFKKKPSKQTILTFLSKCTHTSCKNQKGKAKKLDCLVLLGEAGNPFDIML